MKLAKEVKLRGLSGDAKDALLEQHLRTLHERQSQVPVTQKDELPSTVRNGEILLDKQGVLWCGIGGVWRQLYPPTA